MLKKVYVAFNPHINKRIEKDFFKDLYEEIKIIITNNNCEVEQIKQAYFPMNVIKLDRWDTIELENWKKENFLLK